MSKPQIMSVQVVAEWDDEARVWVATSADVPGLVAEHADFGRLQDMVMELVPLLLVENNLLPPHNREPFDVPVHIAAQGVTRAKARIAA